MEKTDSPKLISISLERRTGYLELFDWLQKKNPQKVALLFSRNNPISPTYRETMEVFNEKLKGADHVTYGGLMRYVDAFIKQLREQTDLDCIVSNYDDLAIGLLDCYHKAKMEPPLIVSQTSQLSGRMLNLPSIDNHSYQLGKLAFEAALATKPISISLPSQFLSKRK